MFLPDWPTKKYSVILADPPWEFTTWSDKAQKSARRHYPTMTREQIKALPVADLALPGCLLFLWGTSPNLPDALAVMEAWGFRYTTKAFNWVKTTATGKHFVGCGYYTRANPEDCWLGVKIDRVTRSGKPVCTIPERLSRGVQQLLVSPVREHSRKPDETITRIEQLVAGPYLELFCRGQPREGWDGWGNECTPRVADPAA
jgi:N6-adenosine-specific RNA methylase IME4